MASRKLAALAFIKQYWALNGASPSFYEIAAALGTNATRVGAIVRALVEDGSIRRLTGEHRAITPVDQADRQSVGDALLLLKKMGWTVNEDATIEGPRHLAVSNSSLPLRPELDHIPDVEIGRGRNYGCGPE